MASFNLDGLLIRNRDNKDYLRLKELSTNSDHTREIRSPKINRPGLALSGFFDGYDPRAVQLFGLGERTYIGFLEKRGDYSNMERIFSYKETPAVIFTDSYEPSVRILEIAKSQNLPLLVTSFDSADFSRRHYNLLEEVFAPKEAIHATLMEVYGMGVLLLGESGIGKSETALTLIERGHRIVADDMVMLTSIQDTILMGSGVNEEFQHNMEVRGLGILDLEALFGAGAIRERTTIGLAVHLEEWDDLKDYDRITTDMRETFSGVQVPTITLPIRPGRTIPILIETAVRNQRLKNLGYDSSKAFEKSVLTWLKKKKERGDDKSEIESP